MGIERNVPEGRVKVDLQNVDLQWRKSSKVRISVVAAGLALAASCLVLAGSSSRHAAGTAANSVDAFSASLQPVASGANPVATEVAAKAHAQSLFAGLPLMFEPNQGQAGLNAGDPRVQFIARGSGYSLLLGSEGAVLNLTRRDSKRSQSETLAMKLAGANANPVITAAEELPGKSKYLIGNDPSQWRSGIAQFGRVRYENVYPGINLVFYGNQGKLEYDFQVAPGADPAQAELEFDAAKQLEVRDGALLIKAKSGVVRFEAPTIYQEVSGLRQPVEGHFVLRGAHRAGFAIGAYDRSRELVIDPFLSFASYFGGTGNETNNYVAVDSSLNIYLAGSTTSTSLPGPAGSTVTGLVGVQNVYIAKIQPPQGSNPALLLYVTYLGGNGTDVPAGIAVDGAGNPYVAGTPSSTNFPVQATTAYHTGPTTGSPGPHIFVTRLNNTFTAPPFYSSYLSGSGSDYATGMTIDPQGNLYVTGTTTSTNPQDYVSTVNWPVIQLPYGQPFQSTPRANAGVAQFFVTKVNTTSGGPASIAYSTYFGGGVAETTTPLNTGGGIAVDSNSNIYFTGTTNFVYTGNDPQVDFPILSAYQPCLDQTAPTVIVLPQICTPSSSNTETDAFVAKINPNAPAGTGQLDWSTYVGGSGTDSGVGVAVDFPGAAHVYIVGTTNSPDNGASQSPSTPSSAFQRCLDAPQNPQPLGSACTPPTTSPYPSDAFVAQLTNPAANCTTTTCVMALSSFSYLGGSGNEEGLAIAVDNVSGAFVTGWTQSNSNNPTFGFPIVGGANIQGTFTGTQDAFIARLNTIATSLSQSGSWSTLYGGSAATEGTSITLDPNGAAYVAGDTTSSDLQLVEQFESYTGGSDAFVAQVGTASTLTITGSVNLNTNQIYVSAGTAVQFTYTITNAGPDPAINLSVVDNLSSALVPITFQSASAPNSVCSAPGSTATSVGCTIPSLQAGQTVQVTFTLIPASSPGHTAFTGGLVSVYTSHNVLATSISVPANLSDYSLSISPSGASVAAGNTASFQVQLQPDPIYNAAISLSCSGAPAGSACNFAQTSVTPGAVPAGVTLNITTTARPITTGMASPLQRNLYALWLVVPGVALIGLGSRDRRRRRIAGILLLLGVMSLLVLLPACSHNIVQPPVSGTPAGIYQITVTSAAGSDAKSTTIILNVS